MHTHVEQSVGRDIGGVRLASVAPLTAAQKRLWFLEQLDPGHPTYNLARSYRLDGALEHTALLAALQSVVSSHDALRASFQPDSGIPVQTIASEATLPVAVDPGGSQTTHAAIMHQTANTPFNLDRAPLARAAVLHGGRDSHIFVFAAHHLVLDGWSLQLVVDEIGNAYTETVYGRSPVDRHTPPVRTLALREEQWLRSSAADDARAFWRTSLANAPPIARVPRSLERRPSGRPDGAAIMLPSDTSADELERFSRERRASAFMTIAAAFSTMVAGYTGERDLVITTPYANRHDEETERTVGTTANTLPLCLTVDLTDTFDRHLQQTRDQVLAALHHGQLPFDAIVREAHVARSVDVVPFLGTVLSSTYQRSPVFGDLQVTPIATPKVAVPAQFQLAVDIVDGRVSVIVEYRVAVLDAASALALGRDFLSILRCAVRRPATLLRDLFDEGRRNAPQRNGA